MSDRKSTFTSSQCQYWSDLYEKKIQTKTCYFTLFAESFESSSASILHQKNKYSQWNRKGNIQMFDIKNPYFMILVFVFSTSLLFVLFLFHSITQFGFTRSKTIIKLMIFLLSVRYPPFFFIFLVRYFF